MSRDRQRGGSGESRPGGVVHFAGTALARLRVSVRVVTRVRPDDAPALLAPLRAAGAEVCALPSRATTECHNDYGGAQDHHHLAAVSDPIRAADVPEAWRGADLVQLGPLHPHDLEPRIAPGLGGLVGLDVQGLLRFPGSRGTELRAHPDLGSFLRGVHVAQVSESEAKVALAGDAPERFRERHGLAVLVVTRGGKGATLFSAGERVEIAAVPARRLHPVGAGDTFLAVFLLALLRGDPPEGAGRAAARACAHRLETGEVPASLPAGELA